MSNSQPTGSMQPNMDWMYKPSALVNRDDYLLGRSVDKTFNLLEAAERTGDFNYADEVEKDLTPISIFAPTRSGPVDVINKIKEDPLYQIQKKEEENLKQLLKNPVRMKQMREITEQQERQRRLSASSSSNTSKSKKKESKHRKRHRERDSSSSSSSSDDDSKTLNLSKVKSFVDIDKLISQKLEYLKKQGADSGSDSSDDASRKKTLSKHPRSSNDHKHTDRDDTRRHHEKQYHNHNHSRNDHERHREREPPRHQRVDRRRSRSRSKSRDRDRRNRRSPVPTKSTSSSSSTVARGPFRAPPASAPKRAPLDEAELERRRQEMMSNATWRDEQRTKNVTKYREEEKKEEERHNSGHDPDFIRKQLLDSVTTGSVEKRIKSNSYNLQKSHSAMNQNFARR